MRFLALVALAVSIHAEDAPKPTSEQQIAQLQQQLAEAQAELRLYQQATFQCQAAEIHAQAQAQVKAKQPKETK